jgi:16S rRNA U516 pseudouridylate synthase RsuA-like enzyme
VKLGKLPNGMWRFLVPSEVESLKRLSKKLAKG